MDSEELYACNIWNDGFDTEDEVKNHIEIYHKETLNQINKNIEISENEDDEAFLARFDNDGHHII